MATVRNWDGVSAPSPPHPHPVCTFIPDRTPQFKMHSSLGLAKTAIGYERRSGELRGGVVYILAMTSSNPVWLVIAVIPPGSKKDDHPFFKPDFRPYYVIDERP